MANGEKMPVLNAPPVQFPALLVVTRDPEMRETSGGTPYIRFNGKLTRYVNDPSKRDMAGSVAFITVSVWNHLIEYAWQNVRKGDVVLVDGRAKLNTYTGNDGTERTDMQVSAWVVASLYQAPEEGPSENGSSIGNNSNPRCDSCDGRNTIGEDRLF